MILGGAVQGVPAHANVHFSSARGWEIYQTPDSCSAIMNYDGPGGTDLILMKEKGGRLLLSLTNDAWSIKDDEKRELTYVLDDKVFVGNGRGYKNGSKAGFVQGFNADFEDGFASANSLSILLGEQLVDRLSLTGSSAALVQVNACLGELHAQDRAIERERQKWAHIPADPFKAPPGQPGLSASPIDQGSWIGPDDYPSASEILRQSGRVGYQLTVSAAGRIARCTITQSSGSASLDRATCDLLRSRATFSPATDDDGYPTAGDFTGRVVWTLDE
jgi:TonB family protein